MQELDWVVGELLDKLGIAGNTIVVFTTDNGAEKFSWPDGGTSSFRGEKGLGWEGGFRAPFLIRWPGTIPASRVLNSIFSLEDVVPTMMAAAGIMISSSSYARAIRLAPSASVYTSTATTASLPHRPERRIPAQRVLLLWRT
jgi:arylsulfatase A-like enzyme